MASRSIGFLGGHPSICDARNRRSVSVAARWSARSKAATIQPEDRLNGGVASADAPWRETARAVAAARRIAASP
jgi:hypothetical protein